MSRPAAPFRLTPDQQAELHAWLRQATTAPRLRVRLRWVQLRDQGWPVPQIAEQLAVSQATVRRALRRVVAGGLEGLADRPRSGRPPRRSDADLDAVEGLLRQAASHGQVWTAGQLAAWLARCRGVQISGGRLGALLGARGCRWTPAHPAGPRPPACGVLPGVVGQRVRAGLRASRRTSSWLMAR
jgi:transposase